VPPATQTLSARPAIPSPTDRPATPIGKPEVDGTADDRASWGTVESLSRLANASSALASAVHA
jgi:hypothetical protein